MSEKTKGITIIMFRPLRTPKRKSDLVSDEITDAILSKKFSPGDRLPSERELAQQMRVGRSVVRESLRTLELSGLVYIKQGMDGGIFIRELDFRALTKSFSDLLCFGNITIENLSEARLLIEKDIIELVVKKNKKEDFKLLDDIIGAGFLKIEKGEKIRKENFRFHIALAELSRNPILTMFVNSIMPIIIAFVEKLDPPKDHSRRILESHRDILNEMKKGNIPRATKRLEEHILFFGEEFKNLMPLQGIYFDEILRSRYRFENINQDEG